MAHVRCTVHGLIDQSCKKNDFTVRTTEPTKGQEGSRGSTRSALIPRSARPRGYSKDVT